MNPQEIDDRTAEVNRDEDPFANGLSERLGEAAPRWRTRTTVVLAVGGFSGLEVQKHWGNSGATTAGPGGLSFPRGGAGFAPATC